MVYPDNLYSGLDDESDIEAVGGTSRRRDSQGSSVTPQRSQSDANTGSADTHGGYDVGSAGEFVDAEDPHVFSPTDGYFGAATDTPSSGTVMPASSNVPRVPNVLVEDPSLQQSTAAGKATEAEQERLHNDRGSSNSNDQHTAAYPNPAPASQNSPSSAYTSGSPSVAATHYTPSSSSHYPPAATPASYTTYSTRTSAYHGEHLPFLPREAPPAYTPSPTSAFNPHGFGDPSRNYRTFSQATAQATDTPAAMGRPEETQSLLAHPPESMRDHNPADSDEVPPAWRDRLRRVRRHVNWGSIKIVLIALVLLLITAGFITSVVMSMRGSTGRHNPSVDKPHTEPGEPNMSYPELDGDIGWDAALFCRDTQIARPVQTYAVDFGANKQLIVQERTSNDDGRRGWGEVHVQGAVVLRRVGDDTPNSVVTLEVTVTDERLKVYSSWDADEGALQLIVPHRVEWSGDSPRACVNIKVTVWAPEDSKLGRLSVDAVHLDIKLLDNLSLSVAEGSKLVSTVGTVIAASTGATTRDDQLIDAGSPDSFRFHSRIIDVHTTAAPIKGSWPLYDYLGLQSTSGNIRVGIEPQEADPDTPKPAILYLKSLSGDVEFREPIHTAEATFRIGMALPSTEDRRQAELQTEKLLPPRDYRVDVHTTSGDITGAAAFSSSAGFKSTSGTVSLDLLPVLDKSLAEPDARDVDLSTSSTSGATDVTVLEPLWVDELLTRGVRAVYVSGWKTKSSPSPSWTSIIRTIGVSGSGGGGGGGSPPLRCLYSSHTSTSADIKLRYPASWEGDISLSSLTGVLQVGGEGVKLIKAGSDWPGINKMLLARKGVKGEGGKLTGKGTSGGVDVWVGKK